MIGKKIVLSNDPELLQVMKDSFFRRAGFALLVANTGRQAYEMIEEEDPLLVILGLNLAEMPGDQCCRLVKDDPILRTTPIVLLAKRDDQKDLERCQKANCDRIVTLPFVEKKLVAVACELLHIGNRGEPRIPDSLPVRWGNNPRKLLPGTILNLNCGGLFIETRKLYPVDTVVTIDFELSDHFPRLHCEGRVAWVNHPEWIKMPQLPTGVGIQLTEISDGDRQNLIEYLTEKTTSKAS